MSLVVPLEKCAGDVDQEVYKFPSPVKGNYSEIFRSKNYILLWKYINEFDLNEKPNMERVN
jgi:hypothetical protein